MQISFKAVSIANELDLNIIANHFGIKRKFKWEDFLLLKESQLQGVVASSEEKCIYLFHFGVMVCINLQHHEIMDIILYLKKLVPMINDKAAFIYEDDYSLFINDQGSTSIDNDSMSTSGYFIYQSELIATALAKSVALEKNEMAVDILLDKVEAVVNSLSEGELTVSDKLLAKMRAEILQFKLGAISHLMILDNPDITWDNVQAAELYSRLSLIFELKERFNILQHKTQTLMDIAESFSDLVHAKRSTRLEWIIIILIALEFGLAIYEKLLR